MDQFRKQISGLEKRFQEAEKSLHEASQKLYHLNQRLSDPNLYRNQKETYETVQAHKQVKEQVKELTQIWEFLALELKEMKMMNLMVYLQVEWIDGKMFERHGLGSDGELYHPQDSHFCGDLDKKAKYAIDDCWYKFSPLSDDFSSLTDLVNRIDATPIAQFDTLMESHFDVDSVINWLAVNVLVADGDTYNKNYFLYRSKKTGKWSVVPWDYDLTFGRTFDTYLLYPESVFNDRFIYFYPPELGAYNPLKEKLLRNPVLLSRFQIRLAHLMGLQEEYGKPGFGIFSYKAMSERIALLKE